jgi:2,3-bisphosphoglycerate-independent phosphoglycerate mutase
MHKKVALVILDGWGTRDEVKDNAIAKAKTPFFDELWNSNPHTLLEASGEAVGLPKGQMGNSEVGHTTIGSGTILDTDLVRISKLSQNGELKNVEEIKNSFLHVKRFNSKLHLIGLLGDGGVHALQDHLISLMRNTKEEGLKNVVIHGFTDGRDTAPNSALKFVGELDKIIDELGNTKIGSLSGRYYAMDRDNNWDRLEPVAKILLEGKGKINELITAREYIEEEYYDNVNDEHLRPIIIENLPIEKDDAVIFFNYRPDRARMLSLKISEFAEENNVYFVTMTEYDSKIKSYIAFGSKNIETTLAKELSLSGKTQVHIAETEKYAHATYFLNGGVEGVYDGETHLLIPSRKDIATHDEAPEMKAKEISDETIKNIINGVDFLFVNFANPDMIGHTGNVPAIITAIETVDKELKRILDTAKENDYVTIVTADHGNAELNKDQNTDAVHTAHTTNLVPFIISGIGDVEISKGGLADVAPTIFEIMGIRKPEVMIGESLIKKI